MGNTSIRNQIIEYLQYHHEATASTLSRALGVTIPNIHYHLKKLLKESIVIVSKSIGTPQRGRPELYYHLSQTAIGNNYEKLSATLLALVANISSDKKRDLVLQQLAEYFAGSISPPENIIERLSTAVKFLQQCGYQPSWEAHKNGPHLFLGSCPYASLVNKYPLLCNLDQYILEELTGFSAKMIQKMDAHAPYKKCTFALISKKQI